MRGIIVLEGPDGAGKTTLANELVKRHGARYIHLTYRWKQNIPAYHMAAFRHAYAMSLENLVIIDRWWPSESLYAAEFRNGTRWPHLARFLDRTFMRYGLYVFCLPGSVRAYRERFERLKSSRVEMYDSVLGVMRRYLDLFYGSEDQKASDYAGELARHHSGIGHRSFKYTIEDDGSQMGVFCDLLLQELQFKTELADDVVGSQDQCASGNLICPRALLVADRPNVKNPRYAWPFFENGNCSLFLNKALAKLRVDERHLAWVNINYGGGVAAVRNLLRRYNVRVVILGSLARRTYEKSGLNFLKKPVVIGHPQWYRRFHANDGLFEKDLRRALGKLN